jgi:hypothetical protein
LPTNWYEFKLVLFFFPDFSKGQAPPKNPPHRMSQSEVTIMCFNNGNNDGSCLWLIIIVILIFCCGSDNSWGGNNWGSNCGCGCCHNHNCGNSCSDNCTCC